jgi:hypothetical protein
VTATGVVLSVRFNLTEWSYSRDLDGNSTPDDCQSLPAFVRGDANADGKVNIADPVKVVLHLFRSEPVPCADAADADDDGTVGIDDPIEILNLLFRGGDPLPPPGDERCGIDPTNDALGPCTPGC